MKKILCMLSLVGFLGQQIGYADTLLDEERDRVSSSVASERSQEEEEDVSWGVIAFLFSLVIPFLPSSS